MKPSAEDPLDHFSHSTHDRTVTRLVGESEGFLHQSVSHIRHPTYISLHYHYPPGASFSREHGLSYPESSQRTNAHGAGNPYPPSYHLPANDQSTDARRPEEPLTVRGEHDLNQIPAMDQYRSDPYLYHGNPSETTSLQQRHVHDRFMPRSNRFRPPYSDRAPEQLHLPPMLLTRSPSPETPLLQARYSSQAHSETDGVPAENSVAAFETDAQHRLTTPLHSPFPSSNPTPSNAGWSVPSLLVDTSCDRAPPPGGAISSTIVQAQLDSSQRSESPASTFCLSEPTDMEYGNPDTAASSTLIKRQSFPSVKKKKSKMHECEVCGKMFPRPSGLKTHMNTHNNLKPFPCGFAGCSRTFTVRSNAKRHLRTHGVDTSSVRETTVAPYVVGFETPTVLGPFQSALHKIGQTPYKLKWMPPSLTTRTNAHSLTSLSDDDSEESDAGQEEEAGEANVDACAGTAGRPGGWRWESSITIPLTPVLPSSPSEHNPPEPFEERNSYAEASLYPYHPSQFRSLPGPAVASPQSNSAE